MPDNNQQQTGATNGGTNQSTQGTTTQGTSQSGDGNTQTQTGGTSSTDNKGGTSGTQGTGTQSTQGTGTGDGTGGQQTVVKTGEQTGGQQTATVAATWPTDWRQQMAGEDKEYVKQLERYASPQDLIKKLKEQDRLISSGTLKQPLPKDATAEQIAAYRKENGIPETADKYDLTLPDGLVVGEDDKPIVKNMLDVMHGMNLNNDQVKQVLAAYYQNEKQFLAGRETEIATNHQKVEDTLRAEWGNEYRGEVNRIEGLLNTFPAEAQQAFQFGHDQNGMPLLDNIHVLRALAVNARMINPVTTLVPAGGTSQMASVESEITAIEERMAGGPNKEDSVRDAYFKDEKAQARYRELITWRENQKERNKNAA